MTAAAVKKFVENHMNTLNDKYAFDAPSSNGYVGILWSIGALHDRAFKDCLVTGKIRRMTYNSMLKKFDTSLYNNTPISSG